MVTLFEKLKKIFENAYASDERFISMQKEHESLNEIDKLVGLLRTGTYFNAYHKVHVNPDEDELKRIIVLLHECTHAIIGETFIGYFIGDYYALLEQLITLSNMKKLEYFEDYLNRIGINDEFEKMKYIGTNVLELDVVLSQKKGYIEYIEFCIKLYAIASGLHENSLIINEGFATFVSLNFSEKLFAKLFPFFQIDKMPDNIKKALHYRQNMELDELKKQPDSYYYIGYSLAEKLFNKFGEDGLIFSVNAATNVPYFAYDLLGCSLKELRYLSQNIYNCDKRWTNFYHLDADYVKNAISNPNDFTLDVCKKICSVEDFQTVPKHYDYSTDMFTYYGYLNPTYVQNIKLLGSDYYDVFIEMVDKRIKEEKTHGPNMSSINTIPFLYERADDVFTELFSAMLGIDVENSPDKTPINIDDETFERQSTLKRAINTMGYIMKYAEIYNDDKELYELINSDTALSEHDVKYIKMKAEVS